MLQVGVCASGGCLCFRCSPTQVCTDARSRRKPTKTTGVPNTIGMSPIPPGPPKASRVKRAKTLAIAIVNIHGFTDVSQVSKSFLTDNHVVFIELGAEILERNPRLSSLCQIHHILNLIIWKFPPEKPYCTSKFILDGSKFHGRYPFMGLGVQ